MSGIEELILIPHLYLHQIPFAALPVGDSFLGDKFLLRYVFSCQILEFCQQPNKGTRQQQGEFWEEAKITHPNLIFGTVENATGDLVCASFECEEIAKIYAIPKEQRLQGSAEATVANYRQLVKQQQVQILHSSHHAGYSWDNPLESSLELADGKITLGELLTPGWRVPNLIEVFLSCCETNLGEPEITDDIFTIAAGFLCAGAKTVISTLWSVEQLATALLCIFYYQECLAQERQQVKNRPLALQKAQIKLRSLTGNELQKKYKSSLDSYFDKQYNLAVAAGNQDVAQKIFSTQKWLKKCCQDKFPFKSAYYWAGFICQGLR